MKVNGIDIDTSAKDNPSARINWSRIVGSAANGAKNIFEPVMPNTIGTISNAGGILRDIRNATRTTKSYNQRQLASEKNSASNKKAVGLFKSAFDDIQSGSFTIDKINDDLFDDYESDTRSSFNMPTGDEAANMSSEEILLIGNKGVAQSIIQSSSAQLRGLQESSKALINANIKSTQALGISINNSLHFGFNQINTNLTIQNQKLDSINRNLQAILEFNNTNAIEFYSKSIDMIAGLGKMMENMDKATRPDSRKRARKFDVSNGFDIKSYLEYIKDGYAQSLVGTTADLGKTMVKDFGIMGFISDLLIPKDIKKPLEKFDKQLTRFFEEGFKRVGEKLNENSMFQLLGLGDILGSTRERVKSINMGAYMKDAMPWNGMAQKALVEVIPELLTSIDSKLDNSEKRYFDYEKGQFKSKSRIEEEMQNEYFDNISFMIRDSMDTLTETLKKTGRSEVDRESLLREIDALIDDQLSGSKSTMESRKAMTSKMKDFGVDDTGISEFIMEFQEGLEEAISRINDMYHTIGTTQSQYSAINNSYGDEYYRKIIKMHRNHDKSYRGFSFLGMNNTITDYIKELQLEAGIVDIDLSEDDDFIKAIINAQQERKSRSDLIKMAQQKANEIREKEKIKDKVQKNKFYDRIKNKFSATTKKYGSKLDTATNKFQNFGFETIYMDNLGRERGEEVETPEETTSEQPKPRRDRKKKNKPASTRMTNNAANVSSQEERALAQIDALSGKPYDDYIEQSETENNRDQMVLAKAFDNVNNATPINTPEGQIAQTTNSLKVFLGGLMSSFMGFTSRLFGKEGFFRKFWDSETRKNATNKIKDKLFTGEDAIFKTPYEKARAGLRKLKDQTLGYLGQGYDYAYDGTMRSVYGDNYEESEKWKNNTFVSQTLNRKWRAEQKKRKAEAAQSSIETEESANNNVDIKISNAQSQLLGLPEHTQSNETQSKEDVVAAVKAEYAQKQRETRNKINDFVRDNGGLSNAEKLPEYQELMDEVTNIRQEMKKSVEAATALNEHTTAAVETFVGDTEKTPESKAKEYKDSFWKKLKATMPKALAVAGVGAGVGLLNNSFSLLGSMFLPGGPIAGAIVGGGLTILSQTEAFKSFMFGKQDPQTQKREGGLISEEMRAKFKQMAPYAVGGAVLGGLKGVLKSALGFNTGLGVLGMQILPGGVIGGAMLGAGLGILKNSESFKKLLFGEKGEDGKRSGTIISNSFNKVKSAFSGIIPGLKKAGKGLAIGGLTGAVLANAGYLPAMLSLGGPVGMGIAGLGIGIASSTKTFNEWMFGSDILDENGNPTGKKYKDGILTRVQNLLKVNVVEPIGDAFKSKMLDLVDWTKDKITYPFRLAFGPILDSLLGIKDNVVDFVKDKFEAISNGISSMIKSTLKTLFSPITKLVGFVGKSIMNVASAGTKLALSPLSMGLQTMRVLTAGKRRKEYIDYYKDYYKNGVKEGLKDKWNREDAEGKSRGMFGRMADTISAYLGQGEVADEYKSQYNENMTALGKNHLNWRNIGAERKELKKNRKDRIEDEKKWKGINKYRSKIINELGGREVELTDDAVATYRKKFNKLGIDKEYLQNSDDIMQLLYDRDKFKKRLDHNNIPEEEGPVFVETPEQKAAREQTEAYQNHVMETIDAIASKFGIKKVNVKTDESIQDKLDDIAKSTSEQASTAKANLQVMTGAGDSTVDGEIKKDYSDSFVKKMSPFAKIKSFFAQKKKDAAKQKRDDAEAAESEAAREGTDQLLLPSGDKETKTEEKESVFSKVWKKVKGVGSTLLGIIGSSTVGSILLKGAKTLGVVGLLSGLGIGIMEIIKPGTQDKILAKTNELTNAIENGNFYEDYIKPKLSAVVDKLGGAIETGANWFGENFPSIFEDHILPKIKSGAELIANNADTLVDIVKTIVVGVVPPLANALVEVVPTVGSSFTKAIYNATIAKITGKKIGDDAESKKITDASIPDATDKDALVNAINSTGKGSYVDATTGEVKEISGASATIDENGNISIEYNEDNTTNTGAVNALAKGVVKGTLNANKAGLTGKVGRQAASVPLKLLGGVGGSAVGATTGMIGGVGGSIAGAATGGIKGAKFGTKVSNVAVDNTSKIATKLIGSANMQRTGSKAITKAFGEGVESSTVKISAEQLEKSIQEATQSALAKASSGGGALAVKLASEEAADNVLSDAINASITATLAQTEQSVANTDAAKAAVEKAINASKEKLLKETGSESYTELAEKLAKSTVTEVTEEAVESSTKNIKKKGLKAVFEKIQNAISKLGENSKIKTIIAKFTTDDTIIGKFIKGFGEIVEKLAAKIFADDKIWMKAATKVADGMAELGLRTTPIAVLFAAADLANGAWSAENLFRVPKGQADWLMRLISALFEFVLGISPIYIINIIIEVAQSILDTDWKCQWATKIYNFLAPADGGWGLIGDDALADQQIALQIATDKYNAANGTNISVSEYNDKINKGIGGTVLDGLKTVANVFGANYSTQWNSSYEVTDEEIAAYKASNGASLGYGTKTPAKLNGLYAQGDSRWAKMPIGMLPNGSVATMDQAGCGPTALAAVANTAAERAVGYGPITPADMAAYAASNGYISQGGANAGLFTEGAARLGLKGSPIANAEELRNDLISGRPAILSGKSTNSSDPYTSAGHIVMADGINGNNVRVLDPITGKYKMYDIKDISRNTDNAWSYSAGYGPAWQALSGDMEKERAVQIFNGSTTSTAPFSADVSNRILAAAVEAKEDPGDMNSYIINKNLGVSSALPSVNPVRSTTSTVTSSTSTTSTSSGSASAGIVDSSKYYGYNTTASGIDTKIMEGNYNTFLAMANWWLRNYSSYITSLKTGTIGRVGRNNKSVNYTKLHYVLSTQYFGTSGGTYGTISIKAKYNARGNYSGTSSLTEDIVAKMYAAAIISENAKGNTFVTYPLSTAEKFLALCNGVRVMYGLANALKFFCTPSNYQKYLSMAESKYSGYVDANISIDSDVAEAVASAESTSSGITSIEQLKEVAAQKGILGKLGLIGKIFQAQIQAMTGDSDWWTEFTSLTSGSTGSSTSTGASTSLQTIMSNPQNIQEELLGKTIENVYRGESGGNYASVTNDSDGKPSIGPYQAHGENAVALLKDLGSAQGIPYNVRRIFSEYQSKVANNGTLTDSERSELSEALANESYSNEIKKVIDNNAMKFYHKRFYKPHYAKYYDTNIIKDLRTLPMLADIGNTGPALITDSSKYNSFMHHWTPTTKDADFEAAYNLLTSSKLYWKNSAYAKGYMNRIKATHDNLKDYTFKRSVDPGNLQYYFNDDTNPLGYGPDDVDIRSEKQKAFTNSMNIMTDAMIDQLVKKTGLSAEDLGFSTESSTSEDGTVTYSSSDYKGTYSMNNDKLISLTGTDRDRFIAAAKSQIGYLEKASNSGLSSKTANPGNNSYTKYAKEISGANGPGHHWCNYFTSWAGKAAGIPTDIIYRNGGCTTTMNYYKNNSGAKGTFKSADSYKGSPGDLVFFNWNGGKSTANHIGIVTGQDGDNLYTIEGNTSNGGAYDAATAKTRSFSSGSIIGFVKPKWTYESSTVSPSDLLTLGYGKANGSKIDSPAYREQMRKSMNSQEEFRVSPSDFEAIGFGPGMKVDAGFDTSNTDSRLDKIVSLMAEWYEDTKKNKAAQSSETTNINVVKSNTNNISQNGATSNGTQNVNIRKNRDALVNNHFLLSSRSRIHDTI